MQPNLRRCISCRCLAPKEHFLRVVRLYPSLVVQLDQGAGRSAYLCRHADCLRMAEKKNRLARALKVAVPMDIYQQLWQRLDLSVAGKINVGK